MKKDVKIGDNEIARRLEKAFETGAIDDSVRGDAGTHIGSLVSPIHRILKERGAAKSRGGKTTAAKRWGGDAERNEIIDRLARREGDSAELWPEFYGALANTGAHPEWADGGNSIIYEGGDRPYTFERFRKRIQRARS